MSDGVERIADISVNRQLHVAVAESLTSGALASRLGAGPRAADWFRGGVVAYDESVKFDILGVTPGPLVSKRCAREMATGVARLLGAEVTVGVTGVGGPGPSEGKPAGTVVVALHAPGVDSCSVLSLSGPPDGVISATVDHAVRLLAELLSHPPR